MSEKVITFAETLTPEQRRKARNSATLSACFGSIPAVMLSDSAIVMVFIGYLGMGDNFKIMTTGMSSLAHAFLTIPAAYIADRFGFKRTIRVSVIVSIFMFLLLSLTPYMGGATKTVVILSTLGYSLTLPFYTSSWFPLLDTILLKADRGPYFSVMRFSWQVSAFAYIFISGFIIGKDPPLWVLQAIIMVSVLISYGRFFFIGKIPAAPPEYKEKRPDFKTALSTSASNSQLVGFSIYLFCLNLSAVATVPLAYTYLRTHLGVPSNQLVIISAFFMIGTTFGYLLAHRFLKRFGTKKMILFVHFMYAAINFGLFFCSSEVSGATYIITALLTLFGVAGATLSIISSTEMLALARPGNKAMAMAFCGTFSSAGIASSRLLTSLVIDSGLLAPVWSIGTMQISKYQTFFLFFACAICFVSMLLLLVPAVIPKQENYYDPT